MELLENGELMRLIEEREIIADEFPIGRLAGATGVSDQQMDVVPVADGA
jgi:hypothetical protein